MGYDLDEEDMNENQDASQNKMEKQRTTRKQRNYLKPLDKVSEHWCMNSLPLPEILVIAGS